MERFVVPAYLANDASNFIAQVSDNPVFMTSNHDGHLLNCKLQETKGFDLVFDDQGKPKFVKSILKYDDLVHVLKKQKWKTFVIVENSKNTLVNIVDRPRVANRVFLEEIGVPGQSKFHYFGEDYVTGRESTLYTVSKPCILFSGYLGDLKDVCEIVIPFEDIERAKEEAENMWKRSEGRLMFISGMHVPIRKWSGRVGGKMFRTQSVSVVVSNFWYAEDKFDDVAKYVPHINSYDVFSLFRNISTGELLYPDAVNKLIWYDIFYVKMGDPTLNLILCGESGSAKTHAVSLYANYFADGKTLIDSKNSTQKGLVPSFAEDGQVGSLASAKFFVCVDEVFQLPGSAEKGLQKQSNAYESYLRKLLPVLTRKEMNYSSGNSTFKVVMRASFMGTDNITPATKLALQTLIHDDPAVLRRFSLAYLDKAVWSKVKSAPQASDDDNLDFVERYWEEEYHIPPKMLKRVAEFLRLRSRNLPVDSIRVDKIIYDSFVTIFTNSLLKNRLPDEEFYKSIDSLYKMLDYHPHVNALVRCSAVNRALFKETEEKLPDKFPIEEEDYVVAQGAFEYMLWSMLFMFEDVLAQKMGLGGITRSA